MNKARETHTRNGALRGGKRVRFVPQSHGAVRRIRSTRHTADESGFDPIRHEYAAAVEMIQSVLASGNGAPDPRVQYWVQPFSKVSGDFFCSTFHGERGWFGLFADAAGHGLPAAIYTLHIPALFREAVLLDLSLTGIYDHISRFLLRQQVFSEYICGALIHVQDRNVAVLNAGIPEVLLASEDGRVLETFGPQHLPMGIETTDLQAEPQRYRLARDEQAALILGSDGLIEPGCRTEESSTSRIRTALALGTAGAFEWLKTQTFRHRDSIHDDASVALIPIPLTHEDATSDDEPAPASRLPLPDRILANAHSDPHHASSIAEPLLPGAKTMATAASPDPLTGLPSRDLLNDRGRMAVVRARRGTRALAVLFIDLDRFSAINDSLGLDVGDRVLLVAAKRLAETLRQDDTISRYGNDEFVCLLDIAEQHDAAVVAHKLLAALAEPLQVAGHSIKLGASIGVSIQSKDIHSFDDLIVQAARAMHRSRSAGGNLVTFFDAETDKSVGRHFDIEARLNAAIDEERLEVFLQPKVDIAQGRIVGAEALVRWRDVQDGLVAPGLFIPIAEKSDLIARIGNWVLHRVCLLLAEWHEDLPPYFHIAVNVSPKQFERDNVAQTVAEALRDTGIPPERLQIEVTESMFINDIERVANTLNEIVDLGVGIALDDFGTGYSNLASLSRLPLGTFKLDQSLVRDVDRDASNASIARSVWHLADGLNKEVIAEGIETCAECRHLRAIGYRFGQGYRFGKPMPESEFFLHLQGWTCGCPLDE